MATQDNVARISSALQANWSLASPAKTAILWSATRVDTAAFLLMRSEVEKTLDGLSFEDFLTLTKRQWLLDYHGAVSPEYFNSHKEDFLNIVLTDFLVNLAWREP